MVVKASHTQSKKFKEVPAEVWEEYAQTRDEDTRNRMWERHLPLVRYVAENLSRKLPASVELDSLISAGVIGLLQAIEGFKLEKGVKFKTYAVLRIRGAILDELRTCDWVPRAVRSKSTKLDAATRELEVVLGRNPTDLEMADHLDMSLDAFDNFVCAAQPTQISSLSDSWQDGDGGKPLQTVDIVENKRAPDPTKKTITNDLLEVLSSELTQRERMIVNLYFFEDLTMKGIGEVLDLSESRVCQLRSNILKKLERLLSVEAFIG